MGTKGISTSLFHNFAVDIITTQSHSLMWTLWQFCNIKGLAHGILTTPLEGEQKAHFTDGKVEAQQGPVAQPRAVVSPFDWVHSLVLLQPGHHGSHESDWMCGTGQKENSFSSFFHRGHGHPKSGSFTRIGL